MTSISLITWLDARDRMLLTRWVVPAQTSRHVRCFWQVLTHLGGATATIAACVLPILCGGTVARAVGTRALAVLVLSHLMVQVVKRSIGRPRPSQVGVSCRLAEEPDRFSFPSGHAAAGMSIALAYAAACPGLAAPLVLLAALVGASRVCLGVHYPGDVLVGQLLAWSASLVLRVA